MFDRNENISHLNTSCRASHANACSRLWLIACLWMLVLQILGESTYGVELMAGTCRVGPCAQRNFFLKIISVLRKAPRRVSLLQ